VAGPFGQEVFMVMRPQLRWGMLLLLLTMLAACTSSPAPKTAVPTCIPSGTQVEINAALTAPGAIADLCPNAIFTLTGPVTFSAANQRVRTQGLPGGDQRALLRVSAATLTSAINGVNQSGIAIENVRIDGGRAQLGPSTGDALIEIGGNASGQTVQGVDARDTRSWSTIHIAEGNVSNGEFGCQHATITNNTLGPAGTPDGNWADGVSLACGDSLVQHNTIRDATDGAIVVFGAAGSTIDSNTIIATSRTLLGGINMVDFDPAEGNYSGTKVTNNTIESAGALIKVGIAMGPQVWFCRPGTNYGATVSGNTVRGGQVGYSFPVNGVRDWTVSGNIDLASHTVLPGPGCGGLPSAPGGFQYQQASSSHLQSGYAHASLTYLLGVYQPGTPPSGCAVMFAEQPLRAGESVVSCNHRFALTVTRAGKVMLSAGTKVLWSAPLSGRAAASLVVRVNGDVVALDATGHTVWHTGTAGHSYARLVVQDDGNLVVYDPHDNVLWSSNTQG
ncbi:MAG: hypothetical protein ACM3N4_04390, partial [Nitrososphaerota archaeon]